MSSQTRRISPNEWESLKDDLWNLSRQKDFTLEKVRGVMKERHEFNARCISRSLHTSTS